MATVAAALLLAEGPRRLEGESSSLPGAESADQRNGSAVPELQQRLRGEGGTDPTGAVDDDLAVPVRELLFDSHFEKSARNMDRAGDYPLLDLIGFADVEHLSAGGDHRLGLADV